MLVLEHFLGKEDENVDKGVKEFYTKSRIVGLTKTELDLIIGLLYQFKPKTELEGSVKNAAMSTILMSLHEAENDRN